MDWTNHLSYPRLPCSIQYRDWQEVRLDQQMFEMKEYVKHNPHHNISFTVHVGDIQKVTNTHCAESAYESTASILKKGPLPTFVIPGDNDWYDCPDRDEGFLLFMKHFGKFETKWHKADYEHLGIQRSEDNSELFVFYKEGILFIGIHLINAPPGQEAAQSWDARMNMNKEWVAKNVESYFEQYEVRGVIILGHALRSPRTRPFFLSIAEYFVNITAREDLPVLYLHGDGHDWDVDKKLSHQLKWKHYVDIQVDQGGMAPPVIVDIAPQVQGQLKGLKAINQMQLVVGRGLFRVDRQGGPYEDGQERDEYDEAKHI
jgi:hypothetical protein